MSVFCVSSKQRNSEGEKEGRERQKEAETERYRQHRVIETEGITNWKLENSLSRQKYGFSKYRLNILYPKCLGFEFGNI